MTFVVRRDYCPKCHSKEIEEKEFSEAVVVRSVKLVSTPEPFPDEYYLIYAEFEKTGFFCRSTEELEPGTEISVREDEYGWTCSGIL